MVITKHSTRLLRLKIRLRGNPAAAWSSALNSSQTKPHLIGTLWTEATKFNVCSAAIQLYRVLVGLSAIPAAAIFSLCGHEIRAVTFIASLVDLMYYFNSCWRWVGQVRRIIINHESYPEQCSIPLGAFFTTYECCSLTTYGHFLHVSLQNVGASTMKLAGHSWTLKSRLSLSVRATGTREGRNIQHPAKLSATTRPERSKLTLPNSLC
jgi:hypothetical protein